MKTRHLFLRALFAVMLLVSQQMAFGHAVSHLAPAQATENGKQTAADHFCAECLTAAQLDSAVPAASFAQSLHAGPDNGDTTAVFASLPASALLPFQPRAPPAA